MAAEWGVLGALGVLLAVGGGGWWIVRGLSLPPDVSDPPRDRRLLLSILIVLVCWLILAADLSRSEWGGGLLLPAAISLGAAALVSLCAHQGKAGHVLLLACLFGFVVNCTVEITPYVPGAMWPFWGIVALAMAWSGEPPTTSAATTPSDARFVRALGPILAGMAAVAVFLLSIQPIRAVGLMHQAQAVARDSPEQAVMLFKAAAEVDRLDPLPLRVAAYLRYRLGQRDNARAVHHFSEYAALSREAVQRNPLDNGYWRSLALANMYLATATSDFGLVDEAIRDMRMALQLNPRWPEGWLELARMAAVTPAGRGERTDLLRIGIEATDTALAQDDDRPSQIESVLPAADRAELLRMRKDLLRRLKASEGQPAATQDPR